MGGAAGVNLLLGMVRTKVAAVCIGTAGVGLLANFNAIQGFIGTLAGLGIGSSAVRDIAAAVGQENQQAIGRAVLTLRRLCWLTGLAGAAGMMVLSPLLSRLTFGTSEYVLEIALLGLVILFANISAGQMALIRGMRRIGDMARANLIGATLGTILTVVLYLSFGIKGIVPSLLLLALINLLVSWRFARRVPVPVVTLSWAESLHSGGGMVRLGLVFMWNGLLGSAAGYGTNYLITHQISLNAVGLYSAAFGLSGMFVNFVLAAMGADYYPQLTNLSHDKPAMNSLVNQQTEIGLLLAVPGLLATLVFSTWIVHIFYSSEFLPAATLLQWFILGCLGRVISWPLGFVMLALGKGRWFFFTETSFHVVYLCLMLTGLHFVGLEGVGVSFAVMYVLYTITVYHVARHLTGFCWLTECRRLLAITLLVSLSAFIGVRYLPLWASTSMGGLVTFLATMICLRELVRRIGYEHRFVQSLTKVPGAKLIMRGCF